MKELLSNYRKLDKVAKLYLTSLFCRALYFAWPAWYGFATQQLTPAQVGVYFSVVAIVQLLAEVPTGAFADKYGRKLSAVIGACLMTALPLIQYFGHDFPSYLAAAVVSGIGSAFISGSLEALVYDHPNVSKEQYRHISWLEISFFQIGLILSTAVGGFLFEIHASLPFIAEAAACLVTLGLILNMSDGRGGKSSQDEVGLNETYSRIFTTGLRHLLASKFLRVIVPVGVLVMVMLTASVEFINEATMISYGLEPAKRGLLLSGAKVLALVVINVVLLKLLRHDKTRLLFIGLGGTVIFSLLSIRGTGFFLTGFTLFNWLSATQTSFIRPIIHDHLPSSHRATAMSGFAALTALTAFGGNMLFGWLIQRFGTPRINYLIFACVFMLVIVPGAAWLAIHIGRNPARPESLATTE